MKTLLFKESPLLGFFVLSIIILSYNKNNKLFISFVIILILLLLFYRYYPQDINIDDNKIISPADGIIKKITKTDNTYIINIILDLFNIHAQTYPCNGVVIKRIYDLNGVYNIVNDIKNSNKNEKKIHYIENTNGIIKVVQIAGFLVRRISSSDKVPQNVKAGQYLGIIKFGSRVDLEIPIISRNGKEVKLNIQENTRIKPYDLVAYY